MYSWTTADVDAFIAFCTSLGIADQTVPLRCWSSESNNDPTAHNPNGDASGLFQLMPSTARGLGYPLLTDPHLAAYRALSVADQLTWAARYYAPWRPFLGTVSGFYLSTFLPAQCQLADQPDAVVCGLQGPYAWAYGPNKGFDVGGRGSITVQDLVNATERQYGPRAQAIAAMVAARVVTEPELPSAD